MRFSERKGLKPVKTVIQIDGMDAALRNSIWNVLDGKIFSSQEFVYRHDIGGPGQVESFSRALWADHLKLPADSRSSNYFDYVPQIRKFYFGFSWNEVYDFVEFVVEYFQKSDRLCTSINTTLERELAGYRLIDGRIVELTSKTEIETVEQAIADEKYRGVSQHLQSALDLLSNRDKPDYRNSIKESISAVESMARIVTGNTKATLGDALKVLEKSQTLHGALKEGFSKLYGFTNDEGGIRHAMLDEPNLTSADAIYFLVSCSAFTNYLKTKVK